MDEKADHKIGICLDFDGVVHSYLTPWQGESVIPDDPVVGAREFINWLLSRGYEVHIHSARFSHTGALDAARMWGRIHGISSQVHWDMYKPKASLYIDDRGYRFEGWFEGIKTFLELHPKPPSWVDLERAKNESRS